MTDRTNTTNTENQPTKTGTITTPASVHESLDANTEATQLLPDAPTHNPTLTGEGFAKTEKENTEKESTEKENTEKESTEDKHATEENTDGQTGDSSADLSANANENQPDQKIYLKDYTPPNFAVDAIDLDIKLFDDHARVDSRLTMHRVHEGELILLGRDLELVSIAMNGETLSKTDYTLDSEQLVIANAKTDSMDTVELAISVTHRPQTNTALEGLYQAGEGDDAMFVTQCEPEGFRKITFFPDRPDVLTTYTTRVEADKRYPTLLANGNLVEAGDVADDPSRHYAIWHDPTKKPSYLFACVIADLDVLTDHYTTIEGREVLLEIYAKSQDIDKCHVAMQALKDAMQWDEQNYGRAYDLDRYMIVATSHFNMGAMENKGLNIFNTVCVLSTPETTTDARSFSVKAIVAHEYFHNWTGNRITCRDWFQLCLKEGLTVFRDQSFSADISSQAVQRIDDVALLRAHQFAEDAGPLAHPPRPSSFVEINNFYTTTVYEKGAEIVRMIAGLLGKDGYRAGTDEYFNRYDGQAVTVEDFVDAMSVGAGVGNDADSATIKRFMDWYTQPATPTVRGHHRVDADSRQLVIHLSQSTRHVAGFDAPKALPIPVNVAVFARQTGEILHQSTLLLTEASQDFVIDAVMQDDAITMADDVVVSVLRSFSAPVQLNYSQDSEDLAFLLKYETDGVNQWQTAQTLVNQVLLQDRSPATYLDALKPAFLQAVKQDKMLASRLLMCLPSVNWRLALPTITTQRQ